MKRTSIIISLATILVLLFTAAILSRADDMTLSQNEVAVQEELGKCCDESCVESRCKDAIGTTYNSCGFSIVNNGEELSREGAESYCNENDNWQCIIVQVGKSMGNTYSCYEGDLDYLSDDMYREPEKICGSIKKHLKQECQIELIGGYAFDDTDDDCGCGF